MGDLAKIEMKKVQEEKKAIEKNLSKMKIESSGWRTDAKDKSGEFDRQKKISSLEKEISDLKDKWTDTQNEEVLNISNVNEDNERLRLENCRMITEIEKYKKELKKK